MNNIQKNLINLQNKIIKITNKIHRKSQDIKLIVVSKNQSINNIKKIASLGIFRFGENYIQESIQKIQNIQKKLEWHFIGKIQSNKIKYIAQLFHWCHSIENTKTALLLNNKINKNAPPLNVLIQLNVNKELTKQGITLNNLFILSKYISQLSNLKLRGIMALPIFTNNYNKQLQHHAQVYTVFAKLKKIYPSIDTLSLGTSHDMKSAIISGSTMIRIGTQIFNPKNY
ncbi:uncharacterized protein BUCNMO_418 [Buchnera aphidicola (Nipponaphis monzeni)]|uniref:Pyridoxal phosphate homeostasis protein n=1 Tax=Buchnera aphidicola (Nipponaphis monzeni) TaxID=2495405 RepID=A0A455TAQ2_9GAMM|nr:YggS family pyridoxal phosphate-dependent enzyme [Buchnera aphidicola]BBI01421.1 uncharacterized protein BUCNMO_418 [Buchnera aphidicola (Nipponaphis monzeni)]